MQNIISNAPSIAATSGVGVVDQLANMFADSETPIFNTQYGQNMDALRMQGAATRARGGGGGSSDSPDTGTGLTVDPNRMLFVVPEGHPGAGTMIPFDNPEDMIRFGTIYNIPAEQLNQHIRPPGFGGTHSVGNTGRGSSDMPGQQTVVPNIPVGTTHSFEDGVTRTFNGTTWVPVE
jgi:hypothetical protein